MVFQQVNDIPNETLDKYWHDGYMHLFLSHYLHMPRALGAIDVETQAVILKSRGRSRYPTSKVWVYAPNGDTYTNLDGKQKCISKVCQITATTWTEAIEKANAVFPAKFERFKQKLASGEIKSENKGATLLYLGARARGLTQ